MKLRHAALLIYALFTAFVFWLAVDPAFPFGFKLYATFLLYALLALAAIGGAVWGGIAFVSALLPKDKPR